MTPQIETTNEARTIALIPANPINGEEFTARLNDLRKRRDDPDYVARQERLFAEAEEYRREVNEQERRRLDETEGK